MRQRRQPVDKSAQVKKPSDKIMDHIFALLEAGKSEEALAELDALIAQPRMSIAVLTMKGMVLTYLKRYEEALICYDELLGLRQNPQYAVYCIAPYEYYDVAIRKATLLEKLKRVEEALQVYEDLCKRYENNPMVYSTRGRLLAQSKRNEEALSAFDRALALADQPESRLISIAYHLMNKANVLSALQRHEEALKLYEQARKQEEPLEAPLENALVYNYACELALCGKYQPARSLLEYIIANDPSFLFAYPAAAEIERLLHQEKAADALYERMFALVPTDEWKTLSAEISAYRSGEKQVLPYRIYIPVRKD